MTCSDPSIFFVRDNMQTCFAYSSDLFAVTLITIWYFKNVLKNIFIKHSQVDLILKISAQEIHF
jgi:hypothetical protein